MVQGWKFDVVARIGHCGVCGSHLRHPAAQGYCSMVCLVDAERVRLILSDWKCDSYLSVKALMDARRSFEGPSRASYGGS